MNWYCPNCPTIARTSRPRSLFHDCSGLSGLSAPLLPQGVNAKVEVREREDYVGQETVRLHEGRPIMSLVTPRDDGQDVTVFAPTANFQGEAHGLVRE